MARLPLWLIVTFLLAEMTPAVAGDQFRAGEWEFSVQYDLIGVPQRFPSYTVRQCLSEEKPYPEISRSGSGCVNKLQGHFGRTITWTLDCSTEWEMVQGMGRIHYWMDSAIGDVHLQVLNPHNPPQPMQYHMEGKYLGECPKVN